MGLYLVLSLLFGTKTVSDRDASARGFPDLHSVLHFAAITHAPYSILFPPVAGLPAQRPPIWYLVRFHLGSLVLILILIYSKVKIRFLQLSSCDWTRGHFAMRAGLIRVAEREKVRL